MISEDAPRIGRLLLSMLCCQCVEKRARVSKRSALKLTALWFSLRGCGPSPSPLPATGMTVTQGGVRNPRFWDDHKSPTNFLFVLLGGGDWFPGH